MAKVGKDKHKYQYNITQIAQLLAGMGEAHELTCSFWLAKKYDNKTDHCTNIDSKKEATKFIGSCSVIDFL